MKFLLFQLAHSLCSISSCFAQDSLVYSTHHPYIVERYCFYPNGNQAGTFAKRIITDDGQLFRGAGSYIKHGNNLRLSSFAQIRYTIIDLASVPWHYRPRDTTQVPRRIISMQQDRLIVRYKKPKQKLIFYRLANL